MLNFMKLHGKHVWEKMILPQFFIGHFCLWKDVIYLSKSLWVVQQKIHLINKTRSHQLAKMKTPCVLRCLQFLVLGSSFRLSRGYCWQAGWNPKFIDLPKIQQVRSPTPFQSQLAFYKQRSAVKICACFKHTIKVCVSCFSRCRGTSAPNETHLTVSIYPRSLRSNRGGWGP